MSPLRQMKAAIWDGSAQVKLVHKDIPKLQAPHEAIVKVSMAVCQRQALG